MIRTIFRNLIVAFSLYSKIPMPHMIWEEDDMRFNLAFLPLIGAVIGAAEYLLIRLTIPFEMPLLFSIALITAIPLLITGGFHVDGFMDTQDAFKSYKAPEEKLKILEDPHIGAFAVISLVIYGCLWVGAVALIYPKRSKTVLIFLGMIFVVSRILTGLTSLTLKKAKDKGMLNNETSKAGNGCIAALVLELVVCLVFLAFTNMPLTLVFVIALWLFTAYYRYKTDREFGGVTGDTAGYYLTVSELIMVIVLAAYVWLRPW